MLTCLSPWLHRYGYFSGINRKVQFKLVKNKMGGEFVPSFQLHPCFSSTLALCVGMEGVVEGRREKNGERDGRKGEQKEGRGKSSGDSLPSLIHPTFHLLSSPKLPVYLPFFPTFFTLFSSSSLPSITPRTTSEDHAHNSA